MEKKYQRKSKRVLIIAIFISLIAITSQVLAQQSKPSSLGSPTFDCPKGIKIIISGAILYANPPNTGTAPGAQHGSITGAANGGYTRRGNSLSVNVGSSASTGNTDYLHGEIEINGQTATVSGASIPDQTVPITEVSVTTGAVGFETTEKFHSITIEKTTETGGTTLVYVRFKCK